LGGSQAQGNTRKGATVKTIKKIPTRVGLMNHPLKKPLRKGDENLLEGKPEKTNPTFSGGLGPIHGKGGGGVRASGHSRGEKGKRKSIGKKKKVEPKKASLICQGTGRERQEQGGGF